jgi:hypothetical protein
MSGLPLDHLKSAGALAGVKGVAKDRSLTDWPLGPLDDRAELLKPLRQAL